VIAGAAAALVMGSSLCVNLLSARLEYKIVFFDAPRHVLPPVHVAQVEAVRKVIPKGSVVIYYMEKPEIWQLGLWKRSLFPDYILLPVVGAAALDSPQMKAFRASHHVRYVLLAGASLPGVIDNIALPSVPPNGFPVSLARLGD
jgi:hypothetical protein